MKKIAVILFNLGGPDVQESVEPFLFNLFNDPAIIGLPTPFRLLIAKLISKRRGPVARAIYAKMGGGSPILKNTKDQAQALDLALKSVDGTNQYKTFIVMRYWKPFAKMVVPDVKDFAPDQILLVPLYPQYSTTTTASSVKDWGQAARTGGLDAPTKILCCYPQETGFIRAVAQATRRAFDEAKKFGSPRILFSAHGLPEKIIKSGDPYASQCEMTVAALRQELQLDADMVLCFQSRVGPLKWILPATDAEVCRAGADKVPVVIVPIAFVSDHSETLVELDIEYRHLAEQAGVPFYAFVPAVGTAIAFIQSLAEMTVRLGSQNKDCVSSTGERLCRSEFGGCAMPALPIAKQTETDSPKGT